MIRIATIGIIGESVFLTVDRHQKVGETAHAESIHRELGGKGYNQAVAASRFGAEVSFLTAISYDDERAVREEARRDNIALTLALGDTPSPYGVIVTDHGGDNRVTVFGGAGLTEADVGKYRESIESADLLLINNEVPECVNVAAVRIAKAKGIPVILNPAPVREISQYLLDTVDLFTPNEYEAKALGDKKNVLVTLGDRGAKTLWDNASYPAFSIDRAVDTTGAGDTFSGSLATLVAEALRLAKEEGKSPSLIELPYDKIIPLASAAAALEVTCKYVLPAIPTRKETVEFVNNH